MLLDVRPDAPLLEETVSGGPATRPAVAIEGFAFSPKELAIEVGTEVRWTNADPTEHTVTAEDGSFGSGPLGAGETYATTFDAVGTFAYLCAIHPQMRGTIEVG
ncbi:MAG: cupredoxin family copper-binding protein [Actinobacteria bacterium]|nr:cupredoxin family copper-binding protein [Actinomycetota bacterium]